LKAGQTLNQTFISARSIWAIGLGTLLILAGLIINAVFGFRGIVELDSAPVSECVIPKTYGISVLPSQDRTSTPQFIEVKKSLLASETAKEISTALFSSVDLFVSIKRFIPHAQQRLKCLTDSQATLFSPGGTPTSLILRAATCLDPVFWNLNAIPWRIGALKLQEFGLAVAELSAQNPTGSPLLTLIEDAEGKEYVMMVGKRGEVSLSSVDSYLPQSLVAIDEGRKGYALEIPVPSDYVDQSYPPAFYLKLIPTPKPLAAQEKKEHNVPCIYAEFSHGDQKEMVPLVYDPTASSYRWAALGGKYLVRFQPKCETLPFAVWKNSCECQHSANESHAAPCKLSMNAGDGLPLTLRYGESHRVNSSFRIKWLTPPAYSKGVQLEVIYSPARLFFFFPGLLLIAGGIGWGVFSQKRRKLIS